MAKKLFLLRHGSTGQKGRFVGSTDVPVAEEGFATLDKSRLLLQDENIEKILCSPKLRCRQTEQFVGLNCTVEFEETLREIDFGLWEGKTFDEIVASWPAEVEQWGQWSSGFTFPQGENIGAFIERVQHSADLINRCEEENVMVVAHGGIIRQLICHYLGLDYSKYLLFDIKAGCYSTLSLYSQGGILTSLNVGLI